MRHCRARTFKMIGPWIISKLFSKLVSCVAHYFCEFCKEADHYFPWFCINSSFNGTFLFLTIIHSFYCFQGPSILTWGMLSHWSHMLQRFHLFLASLVMPRKNIRLEWFGRGNINDIETLPLPAIPSQISQFWLINWTISYESWKDCNVSP